MPNEIIVPEPEPAPDVHPDKAAFDAAMARGLADSAAGRVKDLGNFTQYAGDTEGDD
jgi:hypothetical protein